MAQENGDFSFNEGLILFRGKCRKIRCDPQGQNSREIKVSDLFFLRAPEPSRETSILSAESAC